MGGQSHTALVDEWAVISGTYFYSVAQITKVSDKQVRTRRHGDREAHHRPEEVLFSGTEKAARDLFSVLTGLEVRHTKLAQQLAEQHRARVAAAIAYAVARKATGESAA